MLKQVLFTVNSAFHGKKLCIVTGIYLINLNESNLNKFMNIKIKTNPTLSRSVEPKFDRGRQTVGLNCFH